MDKKQITIFLLFYLIGLFFAKDFGISWDEPWQKNWGDRTLAYIARTFNVDQIFNVPNYILNPHKDIGTYGYANIFDILCSAIEKTFSMQEIRSVYIMRHSINYTFYFSGCIFFFLFIKNFLKNNLYAYIAIAFYLLHPRLLAHGFYNGKDSIAQALVAISLFPLFLYYKEKTKRWAILSGLTLALSFTTRMPVIFLPFISLILLIEVSFVDYRWKRIKLNFSKHFLLFAGSLLISTYIFLPIIWEFPFLMLKNIFINMANHPWEGYNFYLGDYIKGSDLPWHYIFVWISITTPITFLIFFLIGIFDTFRSLSKENIESNLFQILLFGAIVIPIFIVIIFDSTLTGGWRHLYFLYPFICYFMVIGFKKINIFVKRKYLNNSGMIILFITVITFLEPIYKIIKMHPHHHSYFNFLAGNDPLLNFDGDYWGSSSRECLEWISENDSRKNIKILSTSNMASKSYGILTDIDRSKFKFIFRDKEISIRNYSGDYYITNFFDGEKNGESYRNINNSNTYPFENEVFSVVSENIKLMSVYKLD